MLCREPPPLSAGWQDGLVNDCPLRQQGDFVFPTSDVRAFARTATQ